MANQIPPAYSTSIDNTIEDSNSPEQPPSYTAPTQFNIGSKLTPEPLVNITQIKAHLALLHAFSEFKKEVEGIQEEKISQMPADLEKRWAWFVALAVQRSVIIYCYRILSYLCLFFIVDLTFGATHWIWGMQRKAGRRLFHQSMFWWYVVKNETENT